ncbi:MAG: hypothetical protein QOG21_1527 [Actinomycetota bacterium]|nr:hypothetical protein [Actinomycetota bacterium]
MSLTEAELPTGTVTFLFTDIEGSTTLLREACDRYPGLLVEHRRLLREAFARHGGVEVDRQGDAFFIAFPSAREALASAQEAQSALLDNPVRVRIGLHTGEAQVVEGSYVGMDVHRAARIAAAAHGGQVVLSQSTCDLVEAELTDLGPHRLKDLLAPEHLYQLGGDGFPPLRTLYQTNLPIPLTPFLGRAQELNEVTQLLTSQRHCVLTLTGPGGTGKTRLALQAAADAADYFPDGVYWVGLAAVRDPALVLPTIAHALGSQRDLRAEIGERRMLLLLDNLEQLLEVAPELSNLLGGCSQLNLLVTSREPLHLAGEREYAVGSLHEPDAVALFTERALAVCSDFVADREVEHICRRVDNLPLAVELAAAWVKVLSPSQILTRLDKRLPLLTGGARDVPERQRTLRSTIEWSYDLLSADEQQLFAQLSIFAGGCTLEAAEEVCGADLDTLYSLVDKSLLRFSNERFWMLETIREYAQERFEESSDKVGRERHARWYVRMAERAEPELHTGRQPQTMDQLDAEHMNLRRAVEWALEAGDYQVALTITGKLFRYWDARGYAAEGSLLVERALESSPADSTPARADALIAGSFLTHRLGTEELDLLRARAAEALRIYTGLNDQVGSARALTYLAINAPTVPEAKALLERALQSAQAAGDDYYVAMTKANLCECALRENDFTAAATLGEEAAAAATGLGDVEAIALNNRGLALVRLGDPRTGEVARSAVALAVKLGLPHLLSGAILILAGANAERMPQRAATLIGASDRMQESLESPAREPVEGRLYDDVRKALEVTLGHDAAEEAFQTGRALDPQDVVHYALESA